MEIRSSLTRDKMFGICFANENGATANDDIKEILVRIKLLQ